MILEAAGLAALAEALDWPQVWYSPTFSISGAAGWRAALVRAAPVELPTLYGLLLEHLADPPGLRDGEGSLREWAGPELIVTEAARCRVQRWHDAGEPESSAEDVAVVATPRLSGVIRQTLQKLPAPVRWHLATHAVILAVGDGTAGYCLSDPPRSSLATEARQSLVVDGDPESALPSILLHEVGHGILVPVRPLDRLLTPAEAADEKAARRDAVAWAAGAGLLDRMGEPAERDEHQAARLCRVWGAIGAAADGARCAANQRRYLEAEAAAAVAACAARASE